MTEKRKPHYVLKDLKALSKKAESRLITRQSVKDAQKIGFSKTEILDVIQSLDSATFSKSMTVYKNNKLWQDVYLPVVKGIKLYVKIQKSALGQCVVISFKQDDSVGGF